MKTTPTMKTASLSKSATLALLDLFHGLQKYPIWLTLSWQDIRLRYRRSYLGPLWITLSMAVMIYSMGLIYSRLFNTDSDQYFPYIASGILSWTLISTLISELTDGFVESGNFIKQVKLPFTTYILRIIARNFIALSHHLLAVLPIFFYFHIPIHLFSLLLGFLLLALFGLFYGIFLAMLGARFRDVKPIVVSLLQLSFFVTPIMWMPKMVPGRFSFIFYYNPFYQLIELVRAPLMGKPFPTYATCFSLMLLLFGFIMAFYLLKKARHRIVFWV